MNLVALRGLLARKLRVALTAIAIVLGVSMIAGTYVLTDTINKSFADIFHQANGKIDAVIQGKQPVESMMGQRPSFPASLLTIVRNTPGVAAAEGQISDSGQLVDRKGKLIGATGGAPALLFSVSGPRFRTLTIVQGREPHGREIAVD
jgi:putative ABC transport system permease protein